jgi:peptide/nickel transport system permease protein
MIVGLAVSTIAVCMATVIGAFTGFYGGKCDIIIQRFVDAWMCFPGLFIILTVIAILGPGLWQVIAILGVQSGISGSRVVRSAVMDIRENLYIQAASAIGASNLRVLTRHILPNTMAPIIILFTLNMGAAIITEASISFLGFGIPPPTPSWGGMLSGGGRTFMLQAPWMALWPGAALAIVVYGVNMFGDALRDLLDPRLRGGVGRYGLQKHRRMTEKGSLKKTGR